MTMRFCLPCLLLASLLAAATAGPVLDRRPDASRALGDGTIKVEVDFYRRVMRRVNEDDKIKMEVYRVNERDNDHHEEGDDDNDDDDVVVPFADLQRYLAHLDDLDGDGKVDEDDAEERRRTIAALMRAATRYGAVPIAGPLTTSFVTAGDVRGVLRASTASDALARYGQGASHAEAVKIAYVRAEDRAETLELAIIACGFSVMVLCSLVLLRQLTRRRRRNPLRRLEEDDATGIKHSRSNFVDRSGVDLAGGTR